MYFLLKIVHAFHYCHLTYTMDLAKMSTGLLFHIIWLVTENINTDCDFWQLYQSCIKYLQQVINSMRGIPILQLFPEWLTQIKTWLLITSRFLNEHVRIVLVSLSVTDIYTKYVCIIIVFVHSDVTRTYCLPIGQPFWVVYLHVKTVAPI